MGECTFASDAQCTVCAKTLCAATSKWFDRREFITPGKVPQWMAVEPARGCPFDCGLCTEHEQHTCLGVLEITSSCNLECPMCYAASGPGGVHLSYDDCCRAIDHLVVAEGRPEVLQLSGGEPTIHPEFLEIFKYACDQPIDIVMINTNGVRLARDPAFLEAVAEFRHRAEIYLQFDSFQDAAYRRLRGESLVETKLQAIEALGAAGMRTILVCTLQAGVNEHEIGAIVRFAQAAAVDHRRQFSAGELRRPHRVAGRARTPRDVSGRHPRHRRAVSGSVARVRFLAAAVCPSQRAFAGVRVPCRRLGRTAGADLSTCRSISTCFPARSRSRAARARELVTQADGAAMLRPGGCCGSTSGKPGPLVELSRAQMASRWGMSSDHLRNGGLEHVAEEFFRRVLAEDVSPADVFRITTTSFMDAYNFDVRQAMKDCVHFVLPTGHIIPFSAYNLLYRDGLVPLPPLRKKFTTESTEDTEEDVECPLQSSSAHRSQFAL